MEAQTTIQKQELIDWIVSIEDEVVLNKIVKIKKETTFNFDEEFRKGISTDEFRERTTKYIKSLPWKK
jgi:hypothetical protein